MYIKTPIKHNLPLGSCRDLFLFDLIDRFLPKCVSLIAYLCFLFSLLTRLVRKTLKIHPNYKHFGIFANCLVSVFRLLCEEKGARVCERRSAVKYQADK